MHPNNRNSCGPCDHCDQTGTCILVEIQTGMGRTGSGLPFEQYNIQPDHPLVAEAFGGGLPLGAFIASTTYARNPCPIIPSWDILATNWWQSALLCCLIGSSGSARTGAFS
ncbi:MAG: aminotransferase class III-fold pyridoxal phosphate-dependent enzyme [Saprospiraceae bacterium]